MLWFVLGWNKEKKIMIVHYLCNTEEEAKRYVSDKELQKYVLISSKEMDEDMEGVKRKLIETKW